MTHNEVHWNRKKRTVISKKRQLSEYIVPPKATNCYSDWYYVLINIALNVIKWYLKSKTTLSAI